MANLLAKEVDDMFSEGFGFDADNKVHRSIIKACFVWIDNCLYITCFEKPKVVLSFCANRFQTSVKRIHDFKALIWGMQIKDEWPNI